MGIFLVAFYFKSIKAKAVFIAGVIAQGLVIAIYCFTDIPYLWLNIIGSLLVIVIAFFFQGILPSKESELILDSD